MDAIKILMIGTRRTGKSSVLASMIDSFKSVTQDNNIIIKPDENTSPIMFNKSSEMREIFSQYSSTGFFLDEAEHSASTDVYRFSITVKDGGKLPDIEFRDVPGEWMDDADKKDEVNEYLKESSIIIFAIDTVHMMEEKGRFFEIFHHPDSLYNMIDSADFARDGKRKLVLFIPLKCEKYYDENRMDEVERCVEKITDADNPDDVAAYGFGNVIDLFKNNPNITIAITPILTMGQLAFDRFGRDENGKIKVNKVNRGNINQNSGRPAQVYYKFKKGGLSELSPKYCEQPLLYILAWLVKTFQEAEKQVPVHKRILHNKAFHYGIAIIVAIMTGNFFAAYGVLVAMSSVFSSKAFQSSYNNNLKKNLKTEGDGYKVIQDPLGIGKKED